MTENVTVALISAGGAVVVGVAAIFANTFWISKTLNGLETRLALIERRLELMEADLKQFYKDIVQIKQKIGLE